MKKLTYLFLSLAIVCSSCSGDDDDTIRPKPEPNPDPNPGEEVEDNPYKTDVDLSENTFTDWDNTGIDDDYFMLGYGYDATGKYAHPSSVRNIVIDMAKLAADDWDITIVRSSSADSDLYINGSIQDCISSLAEKAGFNHYEISTYKNLFKGMFDTPFSNDTSFPDLNYRYMGYSMMPILCHAYFIYNERYFTNRDYLSEDFKSDLENLSPDEVITKYGTHVLKAILLGGRVDYLYRYLPNDENAYYWFLYNSDEYFKFPGRTPNKPDETRPLKENLFVEVIQGIRKNPSEWMIDITNGGSPVMFNGEDIITADNLTLVNFRNNEGLIPIYMLVNDEVKRDEIQEAMVRYLSE